ncbi:MAG: DsbA family protein [Proteobacteria bacterium]|nr:DsbA family protein [Pseudomonadota bacterium]
MLISFLASRTRTRMVRARARLRRSGPPVVHYFHQVDDPYSHLAVQKLRELSNRYLVRFEVHLVSSPPADYQGDTTRFNDWALRDARSIAASYGTRLSETVDAIPADQVQLALQRLAGLEIVNEFADRAVELGHQLWSGKSIGGKPSTINLTLEGNALRQRLGHYLSATFYFEGEWYWGVDRLVHLENRLCREKYSRDRRTLCVPRPLAESPSGDTSHITLEYFPSLRSPYTAISYERTLKLVEETGVNFRLRPVMPMMMRGVPAPREKQLYIISDARREADYYGVPFGRIVDPIGEPVKRAFSLLPLMESRGKSIDYCGAYLQAAWADGVDITTDDGLRQVVESIEVPWEEALPALASNEWDALLEDNVNDMLDAGLWGVPSFRVTSDNAPPFQCWGQDRLWRVETEIARRVPEEN